MTLHKISQIAIKTELVSKKICGWYVGLVSTCHAKGANRNWDEAPRMGEAKSGTCEAYRGAIAEPVKKKLVLPALPKYYSSKTQRKPTSSPLYTISLSSSV